MIISHEHKFIYLPVPKTASASIRKALEPYGAKLVNHSCKYHWQVPHEMVVPETYSDYLTFASVRNPFRRELSCYLFHQQRPENFFHRWANAVDFADFVAMGFTGKCQAELLDGLRVDRIIRIENGIADELDRVVPAWRSPRFSFVFHHNQTRYDMPWREYYTKGAMAAVLAHCERDFDTFGYSWVLDEA